jgi:F-type H+-transporting ATPase subunit delta
MPRISVVAKNYSKALFLAAKKNNSLDKVAGELEIFKENFSTSFAHELKNPVIAKNDLVKIISQVSEKFKLGNLTSNFFASIIRNRRLNLFPEIYEEFSRLIKLEKNILEVELISPAKTNKEQLEKVKNFVEKKYPGKKVAIKEVVQRQIMGGLQIKIGSELIDVSLKNQLESLKKECLAAIN